MQTQIDHIHNLIKRASECATPEGAMGYSQAARNASDALVAVQHVMLNAPLHTTGSTLSQEVVADV